MITDEDYSGSKVLSLGVEPRSDALQAPAVTTLANSANNKKRKGIVPNICKNGKTGNILKAWIHQREIAGV